VGGKNDKPKQEVTLYYMSEHFGICHGPLDYISKIIINEKTAWEGERSIQSNISINKPELFGGVKKEGGAVGVVHYLPGGATQTIPEEIAAKHGRTTATMPAYRGISTAFFHDGQGQEGFYWSANSPYLPGVWIKASRASTRLGEDYARIYRDGSTREKRTVANFTAESDVNAWRLYDVYGSTLAHYSADLEQLIIEDLRAGTVHAAITLSDPPMWVYISPSQSEVLVLGPTGVLDSYTLTGAAKASVSLGIDPTQPGDSLGQLDGPPTEIVVGGTTYMFFMVYTAVVCCKNSGGGWSFEWIDSGGPQYGGVVAASPTHLVVRNPFGHCTYVAWTPGIAPVGGLGAYYTIDFETLLGWNVGFTHAINSVTYVPATDRWFFTVATGPLATLNSDCTAVVASGTTDAAFGTSERQPVKSRRILMEGDSVAAFINDRAVYLFDIATCEQIQKIPLSEWDLGDTIVEDDAGYSPEERAFFLVTGNFNDGYVVMLPNGDFDSNPAHIIYDALTNTDWGMASPSTAIDVASFEAAAAVLYDEAFGLSFIWTKQSTIESFISEVLDHIEAVLFVNPMNGLLTLKLIRDDYEVDDLPVFTPDNSVVTKFGRKLWGETINEIVVTWTNPKNEEEQTVIAQDNANIEAQGGIVSDGRNYYGVRVRGLAMKLAQRDLRAASTPLASGDMEVNRDAWNLLPGDVIVLNSPEDGIDSIVMRVGPVDYGKPGDPTVKVQLVEDIFSLPLADYDIPPDTEWQPVSEEPSPADDTLAFTLPYYLVANEVDPTVLALGVEYPEVFAGVLAAESGQDTAEFELYDSAADDLGTKTIVSRAELAAGIDAEVETDLPTFPDRTQGNAPTVGGFILIEGTDETDVELCEITASDDTGYTVKRGALDTIPRAWPSGTPVWFIDGNLENTDDTVRSEAEVVGYKVLTRTSLGLLEFAAAPTISLTLTARPYLPLRPADVKVNGDDGFAGIVDCDGVDPIPVTWANRNRLTEDSVILAWDAADVTPEDGQTTRIEVLDLAETVLTTHDDLTGTSFDVPAASFLGETAGYIRVSSKRDGLISLQAHQIEVVLSTGYGYGYGLNYGGA